MADAFHYQIGPKAAGRIQNDLPPLIDMRHCFNGNRLVGAKFARHGQSMIRGPYSQNLSCAGVPCQSQRR